MGVASVLLLVLASGCAKPEFEPRQPITPDWNDGRYDKRRYTPVHLVHSRQCLRIIVQKIAKTRC